MRSGPSIPAARQLEGALDRWRVSVERSQRGEALGWFALLLQGRLHRPSSTPRHWTVRLGQAVVSWWCVDGAMAADAVAWSGGIAPDVDDETVWYQHSRRPAQRALLSMTSLWAHRCGRAKAPLYDLDPDTMHPVAPTPADVQSMRDFWGEVCPDVVEFIRPHTQVELPGITI